MYVGSPAVAKDPLADILWYASRLSSHKDLFAVVSSNRCCWIARTITAMNMR